MAPGDSGSLVFTSTGHVVGIAFGGSHDGDVLYFTHSHDLVDEIKATSKRDPWLKDIGWSSSASAGPSSWGGKQQQSS
ncbi:hypothetical protein BO70DRAFT_400300 [Aspergillus heteromorphus CBS 117.55]|uniref:Peptidase S1 domain-containing protein n=1 Tax=Aspergillus heteromorphus CBS 117.55 TaxID=1448321 RepID=A0A317V3P1_9EURO|nr:uncharacterized protein BO70DRAFT_400300 [Aspergillus heteromorphus CBS 117.55]PWY68685.1 hypothetical protein BO70DRAFT_400300 [Aspergillus heteromorphus CBS 117.55]